jgi:glycosyltransferase involved in cell wall biosynthesis
MKVIHLLLGKANPNTMNGVNVVVHNLVTAQLKQAINVEVFGITDSPEKIHHEHSYKLTLFQKYFFRFVIDQQLKERIKSSPKQTLFHLHSTFIPEFFIITKLLNQLEIPYIVTPHGAYDKSTMDNKRIKKYLYFKIFDKNILSHAKFIHFLGKIEKDQVENLGVTTKSVLLPNAPERIDTSLLLCNKNKNEIVFSYCGRIVIHHKGLDLLLAAFINYKIRKGVGALQFIGDGADLDVLVQQANSSGFTDDIHFLGKKFGQEKLNLLCSSDVFLHTSRHDGMPIAALEAADLSLPLLISQETNLGNYVEKYKAGKVLTENNIKNIEESLFEMEDLFNKQELQKYGSNAKKMIDEELNWDKVAEKFIGHYKNILS